MPEVLYSSRAICTQDESPASTPPRYALTMTASASAFQTHRVSNQAPALDGFDPLACDPALREALARDGAAAELPRLGELARSAGSAQAREHGRLANEHAPVLHTHDRWGNRIDEV